MKHFFLLAIFLLSVKIFSQNKNNYIIYFNTNTYLLSSENKVFIDSLLKDKNIQKINIIGFCDSLGSNSYNYLLSNKRANEVKTYLVSKKIPLEIIKTISKGEILNDNNLKENRKVVIEITYQIENSTIQNKNKLIKINTIGKISGDENESIPVKIIIYNMDGIEIKSGECNQNGTFKFTYIARCTQSYYYTFYYKSYFISSVKMYITDEVNENNEGVYPYSVIKKLHRIEDNKIYQLENILFEENSDILKKESVGVLKTLIKYLEENKSLKIKIESNSVYYDYIKKEYDINNTLIYDITYKRAKYIADFLISNGINKDRLIYKGNGSNNIMFNKCENSYQISQNNRIEITILSH